MSWSKEITEWQRETFGEPTPLRALLRAEEEWKELQVLDATTDQETATEAADVVITLCAFVQTLGFDMAELVEKKMVKNRARRWHSNGDGTGYHIKDGE